MTNGRLKLSSKLPLKTDEGQLLVRDVARYLTGLARLHEEDKTGNPELSKGLRQVARVLSPFASYPVQELTDVVRVKRRTLASADQADHRSNSRHHKLVLPLELETMSQNEVASILGDDGYTKQQIAELGFRRFGISRAKLTRPPKKDAWDSIRAALEHERSLDAIARQARKAGKARAG
jgi:hypothetical protein